MMSAAKPALMPHSIAHSKRSNISEWIVLVVSAGALLLLFLDMVYASHMQRGMWFAVDYGSNNEVPSFTLFLEFSSLLCEKISLLNLKLKMIVSLFFPCKFVISAPKIAE